METKELLCVFFSIVYNTFVCFSAAYAVKTGKLESVRIASNVSLAMEIRF